MKIAGTGETLPPWASGERSRVPADAHRFGAVLQEALESQAGDVRSLAGCAAPSDALRKGVRALEGFIETLDDYRRKLADPGLSLRAIDPVAREIEKGQAALSRVQESLPDGDELKEICNRAQVTAAVELFKLRRGDYLGV